MSASDQRFRGEPAGNRTQDPRIGYMVGYTADALHGSGWSRRYTRKAYPAGRSPTWLPRAHVPYGGNARTRDARVTIRPPNCWMPLRGVRRGSAL